MSAPHEMDGHERECALAAYAILIERAEHNHGPNSKEAKELRREYRKMTAPSPARSAGDGRTAD
jgi:hypothetical protein